MKLMMGLLILTFGLVGVEFAQASGCMWLEEHTLGAPLHKYDAVGEFVCRPAGSAYWCSFYEDVPSLPDRVRYMSVGYVTANQKPVENQKVTVSVDVYEAMAWESCDGGDPAPEFYRNGTMSIFTHQGAKYEFFVHL